MYISRKSITTGEVTRAICAAVLLVFTWFSTQAPVTPALSAIVANVGIPASSPAQGTAPVAEDTSNTSVKEQLSVSRRTDRFLTGSAGSRESGLPNFGSCPNSLNLHRSDFLAPLSGRARLAHHCTLLIWSPGISVPKTLSSGSNHTVRPSGLRSFAIALASRGAHL